MERDDARSPDREQDCTQRSLDYLRRRSRQRVWWSSARIAMQRGQAAEPHRLEPPKEQMPFGRRTPAPRGS